MINPMELNDKVIIITGASSGIGKSTAETLSKLGAKVILISRNETNLLYTLNSLEGQNHRCYAFDLSKIEEIEKHVKIIIDENGPIDGFVHCAGIAPIRPLGQTSYRFISDVMDINLFAFIELCRCLSKKNHFKSGASFVGISSIASRVGDKSKTAYCASKAALDASIRCIAKELAIKKIRVNSILPGFVKTEMYHKYIELHGEDEGAKSGLSRQYNGFIEPEEVANVVAFLVSESAKTITGTGLVIDGGYLS